MKNLVTTISFILLTFIAYSQDTWNRMFCVSSGSSFFIDENYDFFAMYDDLEGGTSKHAVFVNPLDENLYVIKEISGQNSDRDLYKINPFTGATELVYEFDQTYIHTADITPEGVLYFATGMNESGNTTPGSLFSLDLTEENPVAVDMNFILYGTSRGMEYNPNTNSLYVYSTNNLEVVDLNSVPLTSTNTPTIGSQDNHTHGSYFNTETEDVFVADEHGISIMDSTYLNYNYVFTNELPNGDWVYAHDLSEFDMIYGEDEYTICMGDELVVNSIYEASSYFWLKDGEEVAGMPTSLTITESGVYSLALRVGDTNAWVYSEDIVVTLSDDCEFDWATAGTDQRLLGVDSWEDALFFDEDSLIATAISISGNNDSAYTSSNHAVFVNPIDENLYVISDSEMEDGDRNLFRINPFMGTSELVFDFNQTYLHTADVSPEGILYAVVGQAPDNSGSIFALDLNADSLVEVDLGYTTGAEESRAVEYNPNDSLLYIYGGYTSSAWLVDVNEDVITEVMINTNGISEEVHGAYYNSDLDQMLITTYEGLLSKSDSTLFAFDTVHTDLGTSVMDLSEFDMIYGENETGYCPNDSNSLVLTAIYESVESAWLKDGEVIAENELSITVNEIGEYQLVQKVIDSFTYIRSEVVVVEEFSVPNVNLSAADNDTLICPGDTILLSGPNGQIFQWYLDGEEIEGATSNTYEATGAGSYNMMKTNTNGCSNMSATDLILYPDSCPIGLNEIVKGEVILFPVPANDVLNVRADYTIMSAIIRDVTGKIVFSQDGINNRFTTFDLSAISRGTYLVELETEHGFMSKAIVK